VLHGKLHLNQFDFRDSNPVTLGIDDTARADLALVRGGPG
jgi:hypothetical protein